MPQRLAVLLFIAMQLVAVGTTNAQVITDRTPAGAPLIGERSHLSSSPPVCSPPKRRPTPPQTSSTPSPASIIQICAPVLSTDQSSLPARGPEAPVIPPKAEIPQPPAAAASAPAPAPAVESADSFKFKIKDVLEAEMKSSSRWLIGSLLLIFVVFSVLIVLATKAVAKHSKGPWIVALVGMLLAGALATFVIQRITKNPIDSKAIDQIYELTTTVAPPEAFSSNVFSSAEQMQRQLAALQAEVREQHRNLAMQLEAASSKSIALDSNRTGLWSVFVGVLGAVLLLALGAGATVAAMGKLKPLAGSQFAANRRMNKPGANPDPVVNPTLPLNAIYKLEDVLSQLRICSDEIYKVLDSDKAPPIDPEQFLHAVNSVRRQLEGGLGIDEKLTSETPVADVGYRFKSNTGIFTFSNLNYALGALDEALSSRYERPPDEWRPLVLAALASARRSLIEVCEPKDRHTER